MDSPKGILVCCEIIDGHFSSAALELLTKANQLARILNEPVMAAIVGYKTDGMASQLSSYGVEHFFILDHPKLSSYNAQTFTDAMELIVRKSNPSILFIGASTQGRDFAARLAARLGTGLTADCTKLEIDPTSHLLLQIRPAYGGNVTATVICPEKRPQMATVRPGVFRAQKIDPVPISTFTDLSSLFNPLSNGIEVLSRCCLSSEIDQLRHADIVVSCGRGIKDLNGIQLAKDFARVIGGQLAASRGAVEDGLFPQRFQVGQTGQTIRPKIYVACGISGAVQHLAGIQEAECIIAINSDPQAPIFQVADYGIQDSIERTLPKLIQLFSCP
jgi:electron transfer flavoprotein alpha subunit